MHTHSCRLPAPRAALPLALTAASLRREPPAPSAVPPASPPKHSPSRGQSPSPFPPECSKIESAESEATPGWLPRRPGCSVSAHPRCRGWPAGSGARRTAAAAGGTSDREPAPRRGRRSRPSRRWPAAPSCRRSAHGAAAHPQRRPFGSAQDGTGWAGSADRLPPRRPRPAVNATGEAGGGDGEVAPRRRGDAPNRADPRPSPPRARDGDPPRLPEPGEQRAAHRRCPPWGKIPRSPAMPVRGSGRQRFSCEAPLEPAHEGRATPDLPAAATGHDAKTCTRTPQPRAGEAAISTRLANLRVRLTPGRESKNATNSVMEPIER